MITQAEADYLMTELSKHVARRLDEYRAERRAARERNHQETLAMFKRSIAELRRNVTAQIQHAADEFTNQTETEANHEVTKH